jgi:TPR repeat protein
MANDIRGATDGLFPRRGYAGVDGEIAVRAILTAMLIACCIMAGVARAEPYDDGEAAYNAGQYAAAFEIFQPLAEQDDARAQLYLGLLYSEGDGVQKNPIQAVYWYRKAADQGHAGAQFYLGHMYLSGDGVPKDDLLAFMWFSIAAARGEAQAALVRDDLAKTLTLSQIAEGQRLSQEWKPNSGKPASR